MRTFAMLAMLAALAGCSGHRSSGDAFRDDAWDVAPDGIDDTQAVPPDWPEPGECSWNGSWTCEADGFPMACLLDGEYNDGHAGGDGSPTPVLPPGQWDWNDADDDLANWRNFATSIGSFEMLLHGESLHHGWRLVGLDPGAVDFSGAAAYFEGSCGTDVLELGARGSLHSFASGDLGDGPDVLVFWKSWSLDFRTGSVASSAGRDDDLVAAGCGANPDGSFDVMTSTVHTGPGSDWVFVRDISRSAVDLGNGASGRTDTMDPLDAGDLVVLRGNTHDFRVMGGRGDDVAVWYVDDNVQTTTWLGPNFFGGGGWGDALWSDDGIDRLVLALSPETPVVSTTPVVPGSLLVRATTGALVDDEPTAADPFAHYCIECGTGPLGQVTLILEYVSSDGSIDTGYFYVTSFEILQIGTEPEAALYVLDDQAGTATPTTGVDAYLPPAWPEHLCE